MVDFGCRGAIPFALDLWELEGGLGSPSFDDGEKVAVRDSLFAPAVGHRKMAGQRCIDKTRGVRAVP